VKYKITQDCRARLKRVYIVEAENESDAWDNLMNGDHEDSTIDGEAEVDHIYAEKIEAVPDAR